MSTILHFCVFHFFTHNYLTSHRLNQNMTGIKKTSNSAAIMHTNKERKNIVWSEKSELIKTPNCNDVLSGRGKASNLWKGNIFFRELVNQYKLEYIVSNRLEKIDITMRLHDAIQGLCPQGRFLEFDTINDMWYEVDDQRAIRKIRQALREGAPELKEHLTPASFDKNRSNNIMVEDDLKEFLEVVSF